MKRLIAIIVLSLYIAAHLEAASRVIYGAESGDCVALNELLTLTGSAACDNSTLHSGAYALSFTEVSSSTFATLRPDSLNTADIYIRYWFRVHVTTAPSGTTVGNLMIPNTQAGGDTAQTQLVIDTGGTPFLRLWNGNLGSQIGSDYQIAGDTWYLVKLRVSVNGASGVAEMKVGTDEASCTSRASSTTNVGSTNIGKILVAGSANPLNSLSATIWYDDLLASDSAYPADGKVLARMAGGAGSPTYDAWTKSTSLPSDWAQVPWSDAQNATSPATGDPVAQTYTIASFSSTQSGHGTETIASGDTINGAYYFMIGYKGGSGSRTFKLRRRINGVNTDTTLAFSTTRGWAEIPWTDTLANINSMQVGGEKSGGAGGEAMTINDVWVFVDYTPAPLGGVPVLMQMQRRRSQ